MSSLTLNVLKAVDPLVFPLPSSPKEPLLVERRFSLATVAADESVARETCEVRHENVLSSQVLPKQGKFSARYLNAFSPLVFAGRGR